MKKNIVCLDTNILIWGIQKIALPEYQDRIERAQLLFKQLHQDKAEIMIPSVVLSEFMMKIEKKEIPRLLKEIQKNCKIYSFDAVAAFKLADIFRNIKANKTYEELQTLGITRQCIKFDSMIVATAVIQNSSVIYTEDKGVKKIAEKEGIETKELPEITSELSQTTPDLNVFPTTNKTLQ